MMFRKGALLSNHDKRGRSAAPVLIVDSLRGGIVDPPATNLIGFFYRRRPHSASTSPFSS